MLGNALTALMTLGVLVTSTGAVLAEGCHRGGSRNGYENGSHSGYGSGFPNTYGFPNGYGDNGYRWEGGSGVPVTGNRYSSGYRGGARNDYSSSGFGVQIYAAPRVSFAPVHAPTCRPMPSYYQPVPAWGWQNSGFGGGYGDSRGFPNVGHHHPH